MTGRLDKKVAIVTGAASGIGAATVEKFLAEGANVLATDINEAGLSELIETAGGQSSGLAVIAGNVAKKEDVDAIVTECVARFDGLDIVVNSAAPCRPRRTTRNAGRPSWISMSREPFRCAARLLSGCANLAAAPLSISVRS